MSTSKLFGKDILITSTTNASGTTIGSISTLGGMNVNQTMLVSGALTSTADSNTIGNLFTTGGNVGFGTTAPVQRLDVNGNLNITGNFFQNGSVYSGSTQWGSTGANIYFNAGNVGIGTLAPSAKLHLRDTGSVTLLIDADSDNVNENDVATLQFIQDGGAVGMDIGINNSNGSYINYNTGSTATGNNFGILDRGQARLHIDSNGDIGISTTSPHAKLTIITTGSLSLTSDGFDTGKIMFGSVVSGAYNTNHRYYIQRGGTTGNMNHLIIHTPNEASNGGVNFMTTNQVSRLFINSSSGNVGIGTTSPAFTLDVNGTIDATAYTGSNISITNVTSTNLLATASTITNLSIPGTLTVVNITSTNLVETNITSGGIVVTGGSLRATFNSNTIGNIFTTGGNVGIGNIAPNISLDFGSNYGNQQIALANLIDGIWGFGANNSAVQYQVGAGTNGSHVFYTASTRGSSNAALGVERMRITGTGNVGINTTSPVGTLDVRDSTNFVGDDAGALYITGGTNGNRRLHMGYHNTNNYGWVEVVEKGIDLRGLILQPRAGNVGIGTTNPSSKLTVIGSETTTNGENSAILIQNTAATSGNKWWLRTGAVGTSTPVGGFSIADTSAYRMVIASNGNVGIGTNSPSQKLEVAGTLKISTNTSPTNDNLATYIFDQANVGPTIAGSQFEVRTNGNNPRLRIDSSGNVGIGTTNPNRALEVRTSGSSYGIRHSNGTIHYDTYLGGSINGAYIGTVSQHPLGFMTFDSAAQMTIQTNGNVGIGTSSPESKLHVNGGITLEAETVSYGANTDTSSRTNTYIVFKPAGALDDWAYIRQVGGTNAYKLAIDIHDDRGSNESFCVRSVRSTDNPDTIWEKFTVIMDGQSAVEIRGNNAIQTDWPGGWDGGLATRDITCTSIYYSGLVQRSDIRKKENVQTYTKGLNEVIQLRPVTFNWKSEYYYNSDEEQYGFIAQEVEQIIPEIVAEDSQGYKNIKNAYIPLLVNSIKELKAELDATRAELAAIKTHVGI